MSEMVEQIIGNFTDYLVAHAAEYRVDTIYAAQLVTHSSDIEIGSILGEGWTGAYTPANSNPLSFSIRIDTDNDYGWRWLNFENADSFDLDSLGWRFLPIVPASDTDTVWVEVLEPNDATTWNITSRDTIIVPVDYPSSAFSTHILDVNASYRGNFNPYLYGWYYNVRQSTGVWDLAYQILYYRAYYRRYGTPD